MAAFPLPGVPVLWASLGRSEATGEFPIRNVQETAGASRVCSIGTVQSILSALACHAYALLSRFAVALPVTTVQSTFHT